MCQLAAYIGDRPAAPLLLESLRLQEGYFGAHATGMATLYEDKIHIVKDIGPVAQVIANTDINSLPGTMGIAHSRYGLLAIKDAAYNTPQNAHPWLNEAKDIVMMHNGDISNYKPFWDKLRKNHTFTSYLPELEHITDSEIAIHMIDDRIKSGDNMMDAIRSTVNQYIGMVLLGVMTTKDPETIYLPNWIQPCYIGIGDNETMFSSFKIGFEPVKDDFTIYKAPKNSFIKLTKEKVEITKLDPNRKAPEITINYEILKEHVTRVLNTTSELGSIELLFAMKEHGLPEAFNLDHEEWMKLWVAGWGDVNALSEPLEIMVENKVLVKRVKNVIEGGVTVPRIMYSLP